MIIYASTGLGKTTYCKTHYNCCDADYYIYQHSNYTSYYDYVSDMNKVYKIVFINHIEDIDLSMIDQVYLAESFDMIVNRVTTREEHRFIPNKETFDKEREIFPNAIILKKNQYLSDVL